MDDKVLDALDIASGTWMKLKAKLEADLAALREMNDFRRTPEETAFLRGQIAQLKTLLAQGDLDPDEVAEDGEHLS